MGIAAGDVNGDGRVDLFATNFRNEANVLYVAQEGMVWLDRTRSAGLHAPSFDLLGFGTQFLDADLDGDQDLVLVNGHVGDLRQHGVAYRMRPQFFENRGLGVFEERRGASAGSYFDGEYLGRGLARIDWNRDGRPDFAVNQLLGPAALVTNHTPPRSRSVAVRLIGTRSNRDAIGATVTVSVAGRRETQQLLSGDGYMASNERLLVFTLPAAADAMGTGGTGGTRDDGVRDDGARDDRVRDDGVRDDGVHDDGVRDDGVRDDGVRDDEARDDGVRVEIRWPAGGIWRSGPMRGSRSWTFVE
jgi:hypothetical protein